jgi:hypothetical protein
MMPAARTRCELRRTCLLGRRVKQATHFVNEGRMGASQIGISLGAWGSLLTINSRQPLRVDGYDPVGMHHPNCQQVSARIFAVLGIRP